MIINLLVFLLRLVLIFHFEVIKENFITLLELIVEFFLGNSDLIIFSNTKMKTNKKRTKNMIEVLTKTNRVLKNGFEDCLVQNNNYLDSNIKTC